MALRIKATASRILAIDWDARSIRLVLMRTRRDGVEVMKAASVPVPADVQADDAAGFGRFLRQALDQVGIGVKDAILGIPREKVVLNTLSVPPTPDDDLPALVQFQIIKELPFGPEEATLDFATRSGDAKGPRDVLVAAVRNDVLAHYRSVAKEAGLRLERMGLRPYANLLAVLPTIADAAKTSVLLVDIGPELTEIDVITGGKLVFSRAASVQVPAPAADPAARMDDSRIFGNPLVERASDPTTLGAVDDLLLEVTRSIEAFRATAAGTKIERVVVAGATGVEATFAQLAGDRLGAPAELFDPARSLDLSPARARQLRGFSAALGLAMTAGRMGIDQIDFLQPKRPVTRRARQIKRAPMAAIAALFVIVATIFARQMALGQLQTQVDELQAGINDLAKAEADAKELKDKVGKIDKWLNPTRVWIDDLLALTREFPSNKDVFLSDLDMSADQYRITAQMRTRTALSKPQIDALNALGPYQAEVKGSRLQPMRDNMEFSERLEITLRKLPPKMLTDRATAASRPASKPSVAMDSPRNNASSRPAERDEPDDDESGDDDVSREEIGGAP